MENLVLAAGALVLLTVLQILWTHPTPENSFVKMTWRLFCWSVSSVRNLLVFAVSLTFAGIYRKCVGIDRSIESEETETIDNQVFNAGKEHSSVPPYSTVPDEVRGKKMDKNPGLSSDDGNLFFGTEGTEKYYSEDEVTQIKRGLVRAHLDRLRQAKASYENAVNGLEEDYNDRLAGLERQHQEQVADIEKQWQLIMRSTEHDLKARISELSGEVARITRPDPHAQSKEQLHQLQMMRGAGVSRSQIVRRLFDGKLEGNSRAKYQRMYDDLVWQHGAPWLVELQSYGLSSQKIVKTVWGDFKDGSEADYIDRVESAIAKHHRQQQSGSLPSNVLKLPYVV